MCVYIVLITGLKPTFGIRAGRLVNAKVYAKTVNHGGEQEEGWINNVELSDADKGELYGMVY